MKQILIILTILTIIMMSSRTSRNYNSHLESTQPVITTIETVDQLEATRTMQLAGVKSGWYYMYKSNGTEYQAFSKREIPNLTVGTRVSLTLGKTMFESNYEHFVDGKRTITQSHCKIIEEFKLIY